MMAKAAIQAGSSRHICRSPQGRKGFTLVEMMVTILVLGILASLAAPSFAELIASQRTRMAASDLFTSLLRARSEAIKRNGSTIIVAKSGGWANGWQVTVVNSNDPPVDDHGATAGLNISGPATITYNRSGRTDSGTLQLQVASSSYSSVLRCVEIDTSGRPTVRSGTC